MYVFFSAVALAMALWCACAVSAEPGSEMPQYRPPDTSVADARGAGLRPRLLVLTDIGGDPDDQQSMIRLMAFANEFDIEGLIASASGTPGELKKEITQPHLIRQIVEAYGKVLPNLRQHAEGYPPAEELIAKIKSGNPHRGWKNVGDAHDTEGSQWIVQAGMRDDPRPLNIVIWGGQTDLAQALWRVRADRGEDGLRRFIGKLRIYDINDQDGIAERMWQAFPGMFYILAKAPPGVDRREGAYRGMYLGGDISLTSRQWIDEHVRVGHGPLGELYPTRTWTAPNPHSTLKEGDTPSWFYFLPNGLSDSEHPDWGCWGGRFMRDANGIWRDARDTVAGETSARATVWRWRPHFQAHFQARMDWCVRPPGQANHAPLAVCNGDRTRNVLRLEARPGQTVRLSAAGSTDPDGHKISFRWWVYREAGTYANDVPIDGASTPEASIAAPADAGADIHVVLEVSDDGAPPLTSYRRVILQVR